MIRLPANFIVLLHRFSNSKNTVRISIYTNTLKFINEKPIHKGRISFTYDKQKFRPFRYEQQSGHTYRYLKAKDIIAVLQRAKLILIDPSNKPKNISEYLEFFNSKKIPKPKLMSVCTRCIEIKGLLTRTDKDSAYELFGESVCLSCARNEIKDEYMRRGIPITASARKFYTDQLQRLRSVGEVVKSLWEPLKISQEGQEINKSSLYDVIEADTASNAISLTQFKKTGKYPGKLDDELINHWKKIGTSKLLPVQQHSIEAGLLNQVDQLVVAGTSSGKTFIGEIAGLHNLKNYNRKMIFVTPLVALTNQKFESFKKRYSPLGMKVAIRVGRSKIQVSESEEVVHQKSRVVNADIIVATYEAIDWILRSGQWKKIGSVGTIVVDEIQLLSDDERGFEVDGLLSRMKSIFPRCQIIGLSATIGNPESLAEELGLELVSYMNRPIALERHLIISNNDEERVDIIANLVKSESKIVSSHKKKGQSLVFTSTRKRVQELASLLKSTGIKAAYYHAGLTYAKRKKIEIMFEQGKFEAVTTTAALGAGADFPVSQVIFERPGMGSRWITVAEYYQMSGRAGRYGSHDLGKSILIATPGEKIYSSQAKTEEQVAFELLTGDIEEIDGEIDFENESDQVLAFISATYPVADEQIRDYYSLLFYQTGSLNSILKILSSKSLITRKDNQWFVTPLGRAISSSFLLPSFGYQIAKKTQTHSIKEIALEIAPVKSVYLSTSMHAAMERTLKFRISRRFLSDSVLDVIVSSTQITKKLPLNLVNRIKDWNRQFFDCPCKENPYCVHPAIKISERILDLRLDGLGLSAIINEMSRRYDIFMYPGDVYNWLDEVVHALNAISRLGNALKDTNLQQESNEFANAIENPTVSERPNKFKIQKKKLPSQKTTPGRQFKRKARKSRSKKIRIQNNKK